MIPEKLFYKSWLLTDPHYFIVEKLALIVNALGIIHMIVLQLSKTVSLFCNLISVAFEKLNHWSFVHRNFFNIVHTLVYSNVKISIYLPQYNRSLSCFFYIVGDTNP